MCSVRGIYFFIMAFVAALCFSSFFCTLLILVIIFDDIFHWTLVSLKIMSEMFTRNMKIMGFFRELVNTLLEVNPRPI